jgi:ABC-type transport system involved in multi-copper enzyme maturation permease subunit
MNPVARRELQERFRTLRSPILLSLWVLAAGMLTFLAYVTARDAATSRLEGAGLGLGSVFAASSMGRFIFQLVLIGLMVAIVFVVPGQAAVTIVGERERQTLPLLQASQLSAGRIVVGKLLSSLAFVLLLLVATTPLMVIPVLLGGVTIRDVLAGIGMVMAAGVMLGAVSIWVSARAKSIQGAVLGSYVWTVGLVLGTLALVVAELLLVGPDDLGRTRIENGIPRDDGRELYTSWLNPFVGMVDASSDVLEFNNELVASPYLPFRAVLLKRQGFETSDAGDLYAPNFLGRSQFFGDEPAIFFERGFIGQPNVETSGPVKAEPKRSAVWWRTLVFEAVATALALFAATRLVKVPRRRIRVVRRREGVSDAAA